MTEGERREVIKMVPDVSMLDAQLIFVKSAKLLMHRQTDYYKWGQRKKV